MPVALPLHTAGFTPEAAAELRKAFASFGFEPVQGGGTGRADEGPDRIVPGAAIGVQLVKGDMSMVGTGTATWADGKRILAFGHRMFNAGEIYLPAVGARVHHTLANVSRSFKIASPTREVGSLIQDRQAGILVDTSRHVGAVPMTITTRVGGDKRVFRVEVARHRLLTATLVNSVLTNALGESLPDVDTATFKLSTRLALKGHRPLQVEDYLFSPGGIAMTAALFSKGLRALREVMHNDFEPVFVERLDLDVDVKFGNEVVEINTLSMRSTTRRPGQPGHPAGRLPPLRRPRLHQVLHRRDPGQPGRLGAGHRGGQRRDGAAGARRAGEPRPAPRVAPGQLSGPQPGDQHRHPVRGPEAPRAGDPRPARLGARLVQLRGRGPQRPILPSGAPHAALHAGGSSPGRRAIRIRVRSEVNQ